MKSEKFPQISSKIFLKNFLKISSISSKFPQFCVPPVPSKKNYRVHSKPIAEPDLLAETKAILFIRIDNIFCESWKMAAKEFQISVTILWLLSERAKQMLITRLRGDPKFECQIQDEQVMW